jgi:Fe-S cluster biosynthesis and repair protein YggX
MEMAQGAGRAWRTLFFAFVSSGKWRDWTSRLLIYKNVSQQAWNEWVDRQKMLLNEYRLQPWTPQAQQFLVEQMEEFFFGSGSALPSEYVPPSH